MSRRPQDTTTGTPSARPGTAALLVALEVLADALPAPDADGRTGGEPGSKPGGETGGVIRADLLAVGYRLLFAELARASGLVVTTSEALAGLVTASTVPRTPVLDAAREALQVGTGGARDDVLRLGRLHEEVLDWQLVAHGGRWAWRREGRLRKAGGSYFTPAPLVDHLLDETLEPFAADRLPRVLDPACGAGAFLVPVARRLTARARTSGLGPGEARRAALAAVHGVDLDPAVLELTRVSLWLDTWLDLREEIAPGGACDAADVMLDVALVVGDSVGDLGWQRCFPDVFVDGGLRAGDFALGDFEAGDFAVGEVRAGEPAPGGFDVVVGNPPFANQLERLTARTRPTAGVAAYTDLSAVFLLHALSWVRTGGCVGLVQPQSLLSTRDAAPVRQAVTAAGAMTSLWVGESGLFDAAVPTCAIVVAHGAPQGVVRRWRGGTFERLPDRAVEAGHLTREWGFLLAAALGVPEVALVSPRTLGDLADCTADFRDQYYGLAPAVRESDPAEAPTNADSRAVPLVTAGLIDPAVCRWGLRSTRFLKQQWQAPVVDLDVLQEDRGLADWAARRLVPKVLLATQGRVLEAVADPDGSWLPSVPVVTARPHDPAAVWRVLAVLLAPPVCAFAATRYAGSALNPGAIKLSAKQAAALPLPPDEEAWARGADEVRAAQQAATPTERREALLRAGATMCTAYGFRVDQGGPTGTSLLGPSGDEILAWWSGRLPTG